MRTSWLDQARPQQAFNLVNHSILLMDGEVWCERWENEVVSKLHSWLKAEGVCVREEKSEWTEVQMDVPQGSASLHHLC